ncbi:heat stress transcription factor A-7a-like [Bidens hawaiensis]|uniref:heat stress transcription factor A-7a-like n=1 Tax=Bidens hawaiensis TaxID=980011 RepID=UPI00404AF748
MNPFYSVVKEEYPSSGDNNGGGGRRGLQPMMVQAPQPMEGLHNAGPPPFLTKVYDMVDDQTIDHIICWSRGGQGFVVLDPQAFSTNLLPRYFKHNNFSSFVRQLNTYGFRKIDPDTWEFANEAFTRGQRHVLKNIKRRRTPNSQALSPVNETGKSNLDEVGHLKHEKQVLMMELVKLKQQQQTNRAQLQAMELRLQGTEKKQQKMMNFLAKAMQNPEFVQKLVQHGKRKEFQEAIKNQFGESSRTGGGSTLGSKLIKSEPEEFMESSYFQMSELEALALEIQGFGRLKRNQELEHEQESNDLEFDGGEKELDDEFWEELFSERSDEQSVDDVDFLGSSPN